MADHEEFSDESFAVRCTTMMRELSTCEDLSVEIRPALVAADELPDARAARESLAKCFSSAIVAELLEYYVRVEEVHASWEATSGSSPQGEICLSNLVTSVTQWHPPLEDPALTRSEQGVLAELKVVDEQPYAGIGTATGLRITSRSSQPEIWFYDSSRSRLELLDLDYGTYLEKALVTKGTFGWQYLFAEVDLSRPQFTWHTENLTAALDRLPTLFPGHPYTELRSRFEVRR
jgi:hypothetical protein